MPPGNNIHVQLRNTNLKKLYSCDVLKLIHEHFPLIQKLSCTNQTRLLYKYTCIWTNLKTHLQKGKKKDPQASESN